jgi:hypothetical protein
MEKYHLGGCRYNAMPGQMVLNQNRILQKYAKVPVFIACNPEQGGNGVCVDGTFVSSQVKIGATGKTEYVEFTPVEGLDFQQNPKPVSAFEGTWNMTGLRDEILFYYPVDSLTFTQTIEISGNTATMTYIGSKDKISQKMEVSVAGGPAIDSDDTGSILILTRKDGHKMPCWLKEDGSLYMKNPGAMSFCFAKE